MKKFICKTCYREVKKEMMKINSAGKVSEQCLKCYEVLGGHRGYDRGSTESDAKWFDGIDEREADLKKRGLI